MYPTYPSRQTDTQPMCILRDAIFRFTERDRFDSPFAPPETVSQPASLASHSLHLCISTDHSSNEESSIMSHRSSLSSREDTHDSNLQRIDKNANHELVFRVAKPRPTTVGKLFF